MNERRPLIGITGSRYPARYMTSGITSGLMGTSFSVQLLGFAERIAEIGGAPVFLAAHESAVDTLNHLDALVLSGGTDIDPELYGESSHESLGPVDRRRDRLEIELFERALDASLPTLGICRGHQLINVALGGSLHQHLDNAEIHDAGDRDCAELVHSVTIGQESLAAQLYGGEVQTNSLHHQGIDRVADDLTVTGRTPDGLAEIIEMSTAPVLGVQWHPELLGTPDPAFDWLVRTALERHA
jgi:putative glutamine amidotransferase